MTSQINNKEDLFKEIEDIRSLINQQKDNINNNINLSSENDRLIQNVDSKFNEETQERNTMENNFKMESNTNMELNRKNEELRTKLNNLNNNIADKDAKNKDLMDQLDHLNRFMNFKNTESAKMRTELSNLTSVIENKNKENEELRNEMNTLVNDVDIANQGVNNSLSEKNNEINILKENIRKYEDELNVITNKLKNSEDKQKVSKNKLDTIKIKLKNDLLELNTKIKNIEKENIKLQESNNILKEKMNTPIENPTIYDNEDSDYDPDYSDSDSDYDPDDSDSGSDYDSNDDPFRIEEFCNYDEDEYDRIKKELSFTRYLNNVIFDGCFPKTLVLENISTMYKFMLLQEIEKNILSYIKLLETTKKRDYNNKEVEKLPFNQFKNFIKNKFYKDTSQLVGLHDFLEIVKPSADGSFTDENEYLIDTSFDFLFSIYLWLNYLYVSKNETNAVNEGIKYDKYIYATQKISIRKKIKNITRFNSVYDIVRSKLQLFLKDDYNRPDFVAYSIDNYGYDKIDSFSTINSDNFDENDYINIPFFEYFKQWRNKELQIDNKLIREQILDSEDKKGNKIIGDNVLLFPPELFLIKYSLNDNLMMDDNLIILMNFQEQKFSIELMIKQSETMYNSKNIFINDDFTLNHNSGVYLPFFIKMRKIKNRLVMGIEQTIPLPQVIKKFVPNDYVIGYQIEHVFKSDKSITEKKSMKKMENFENMLQEFIDELMTQKSLNDIDHLGEIRLVHNNNFDRGMYVKEKLNNIIGLIKHEGDVGLGAVILSILVNSIYYNPTKRKFVFNENTTSIFEYIVKTKSSRELPFASINPFGFSKKSTYLERYSEFISKVIQDPELYNTVINVINDCIKIKNKEITLPTIDQLDKCVSDNKFFKRRLFGVDTKKMNVIIVCYFIIYVFYYLNYNKLYNPIHKNNNMEEDDDLLDFGGKPKRHRRMNKKNIKRTIKQRKNIKRKTLKNK